MDLKKTRHFTRVNPSIHTTCQYFHKMKEIAFACFLTRTILWSFLIRGCFHKEKKFLFFWKKVKRDYSWNFENFRNKIENSLKSISYILFFLVQSGLEYDNLTCRWLWNITSRVFSVKCIKLKGRQKTSCNTEEL